VNPVVPRTTLAGLQHQEQPVTAVIITGHTHTHTHTHTTRMCRQNSDSFSAKLSGVVCIVTAVTYRLYRRRTYSAASPDAVHTRSVHHGPTAGQGEVLPIRDLSAEGWRWAFTSVTWNVLVEGSETATRMLAVRDQQHIHLRRGRHVQHSCNTDRHTAVFCTTIRLIYYIC
jgi:hypothetical protein